MFTLSIIPDYIRKYGAHSFFSSLWEKMKAIAFKLKAYFIHENLSTESLMKFVPLLLMIVFFSLDCLSQSAAGGFASATTTIKGYQVQVSNLMKAIGAVIAIVGAFNVYFKMTNGDQDVKKTIMLTIGGCIAFVALGEALPLFFE